MYRYGIIGFGGLGKIHLSNLIKLQQERGDFTLAAICGTTREDATKNVVVNLGTADVSSVDYSACNFYQDYKEMINTENLDFVLSVLPTYLHEEVAAYALSHGVHILSEKPMALTLSGCDKMIECAEKSGKQLMIGHCLRFNTLYAKIKEYIESGCFGKVLRAEFYRHSQTPMWTWNNWILNPEYSGGCVLDMHIHDVDIINWFFGKPKKLRSVSTSNKVELESITTQYFYDGLFVTAQADWSLPQTFPFAAHCRISFEQATVVIEGDKLIVYQDDKSYTPDLDIKDAFVEEEKAFLSMIIDGKQCDVISPASVRDSMEIAFKEIESANNGEDVFF